MIMVIVNHCPLQHEKDTEILNFLLLSALCVWVCVKIFH